MADQVFDLTQTGQQVQDIINDASKVKDAGAQTTLTTESILLKDINGNYHKILKSSFTEAIRNTLSDLLVNNDKGTTISRIAAIASGDFGSITPTNLASVLGGSLMNSFLTFKKIVQDSDQTLEVNHAWYRTLEIKRKSSNPFGSYIINVTTLSFKNRQPSPATFLVAHSYFNSSIVQLGQMPQIISPGSPLYKVRLVHKNNTDYFDVSPQVSSNSERWGVYIASLCNTINDVTTVAFTDVTTEDVGSNVIEVTPA
jgi:hypothetical protein